MSGGLGADTLIGGSSGDKIMFGDSGDDVIFGGSDLDSLRGGSGDDILDGGADEDVIDGGTGSDFIHGGTGSDTIIGGGAKDFMDGDHAGTDEDVFVYAALSDSRKGNANRDVIDGFADGFFVHPDRIDLGAIDAVKGTPGNQDFAFIGQSAFSDTPGELRFEFNAAKNITLVQGDTNGDGKADIEIELTGQNTMTLDNFVL
jgi:Ca2+-binding RTX toxin-like protein